MTNKEHFKEQIFEIACAGDTVAVDKKTNKPLKCRKTRCENCAFDRTDMTCKRAFFEWLEEEYKEPCPFEKDELVEVSDDKEYWYLEYFDKIEEGKYFARADKSTLEGDVWKYCRKYGTLGGLVKGEQ